MKKTLLLIFAAVSCATAQRNVDLSKAISVIPFPLMEFFPGTCFTGQVFTNLLGAWGSNVYICDDANTWHQMAGGGGGGATTNGTNGQALTSNGAGGFGTPVTLAPSAITNALNAGNISSGNLSAARLPNSGGFAYDDTAKNVGVIGTISTGQTGTGTGALNIIGTTSGSATLTVGAAAGTPTLTLPTTSGTLARTADNVATATALAATPTTCSAGNYPLGVLANGNATGCTAATGGSTYTGTANQVTVTGTVLSLPSTLVPPGTVAAVGAVSGSNISATGVLPSGTAVISGGALGTPSGGTLTNTSGLVLPGGVTGTLAAAQLPAFSGDVSKLANSAVTAVTAVNGTTVPVNSAADQTVVTTASAVAAWTALPVCLDSGGNHLNYNTSTHLFSCGTSSNAAGTGISALTGDVTASGSGSVPATVSRINGTALSGLATGILKNTTTTGVPSIAVAGTDYAPVTNGTSGQALTSNAAGGFGTAVTLAASATTDATNASNISSGTLAAARGGAGTITGALKANGSGLVSQAACVDLSNASASCSTDTTNAGNISTGTLPTGRLPAFTGDVTKPVNSAATTVTALNGTSLAGLATGILKNTTTTGVPSIAVAADFPTLNQATTGNAATATALAANPADCSAGQYGTTIAANGDLTCAQVAYSQVSGTPTLATVATTGSASDLSAGTLPAARAPQFTGDVTTTAGTLATTLANIPTGTPMAGTVLSTAVAAPATPAAGKGSVYVDSTSKNISVKDDAGVVKHGVQTDTGTANNYISAISDAGAVTKSRPSCATLSDSTALCTTAPGTGVATFLATPSSANLGAAITDETGSGGLAVFNASPTIVTPTIASFANAAHNHTNAAGGGQITDAALSAAVTLAKGGTGADQSAIAKGGLLVGTAAGTVGIKAVGSDTQVLTADSTQAGGVKWAAGGTGSSAAYTSVSFSATPAFTVTSNTAHGFALTLTGNVTSSTISGATAGQIVGFSICQDATGGRTLVWPTSFVGAGTISSTASVCTQQEFQYDGTNFQARGAAYITGGTGGSITLPGSSSGTTVLQPTAAASGTLTLPAATDTLIGKATTDTLTNKTFDTAGTGNSFSINGVAATANTGTGSVVRATSPTLVTPALGTPASGVATNITGLPISTGVSGLATGAATFLATPSSANLAATLTDETGSGAAVFGTSPTLVTPALGTPSALVLTNATGLPTAGLAANAVTSAKMAVVNTRRVCDIGIGDTSGSAITNAQLGPQKRICYIPAASTIVELAVSADAGTPNVIIGNNAAGSVTNIVSAALATAASGGIACSNTGGTTGIDGATTCSATLQNTSLAAGSYLELVSGTAGGTAKWMTAHVVYIVN